MDMLMIIILQGTKSHIEVLSRKPTITEQLKPFHPKSTMEWRKMDFGPFGVHQPSQPKATFHLSTWVCLF